MREPNFERMLGSRNRRVFPQNIDSPALEKALKVGNGDITHDVLVRGGSGSKKELMGIIKNF